jgi:site-specific DNA-cytosine methylase
MSDITWAPLIPLIGGLPLGAEKATGKPPEAIYSYEGFEANDGQYVNYQQETLGRPIQYIPIDEGTNTPKKVNLVVATPPCAGLSQLNTGKDKSKKGADAEVNKWMYQSAIDGMTKFEADVIIGENAPALYTNKGQPVAERLLELARQHGYGMTLYKTTTSLHGVPQNRDRTFYIFWRGGKAPIMNWYKKPRKNFKEYLQEIPKDATQQDLVINKIIGHTEPYYQFIQSKFEQDAKDVINEAGRNTAFSFVLKSGLLHEAKEWFEKTNNEKGVRQVNHALNKFSQGLGIWDGSTHVFGETMNAVIGRNLVDTIHPEEDRSLNIREALHMMAFPHDFELVGGLSKMNHIAQNVPVCTAASMVEEAIKFINGDLEMSNGDFVKQNNHNETIDVGSVEHNTLEEFFA